MEFRSLPLYLFLLIAITFCFGLSGSDHTRRTVLSTSVLHSKDDSLREQDSLETWLISMKKESQIYREKGDNDSAKIILDQCIEEIWRTPKTTGEFKQLGWVYVNRAYLHEQNSGDYLLAKEDYLSALKRFDQCDYEDFYVARFVLQPLGNIYTRLGENEHAIVMLTRFQRICEESDQQEALVNSYNDLARAYMNKLDYSVAIQTLKKGIDLGKTDYYNCGLLYSSLAEAYLYAKENENGIEAGHLSLSNFEKAIKGIDKSDYRYSLIQKYLIGSQLVLAELSVANGEFDKANSLFGEALHSAQEIYKTKHRKIAKIHLGIAKSYVHAGNLIEGMNEYQNVMISVIPNFNESNIEQNPKAKSFYAEVSIGEGLLGKARTATKLFESTANIKWLKLSLTTYSSYFQWEDLLRAQQQDSRSKLFFVSEIHKVGEEALHVLNQLQKLEKKSSYAKNAFRIIEQTKGILLSESRTDLLKNEKLIEQNHSLKLLEEQKMQLSILRIELHDAELALDTASIKIYKKKIEELIQKHQLTLFDVKKQFPKHDELVYQHNDTIDLGLLERYLTSTQTDILNFFVGQSKIFLVTGHKGNFELVELDRERCNEATEKFLFELRNPQKSNALNYEKVGHSLYHELLASISKNLKSKKWIILPDSDLNSVPFEALVYDTMSKSKSFKKLNYLLHKQSISYAPSAKFILKKKTKKEELKPYLGIAPIFKNDKTYAWLKNSESEVQIGKEIFGGELLTGSKATKQAFLKGIEDYRIVH
ncbi:MAG: tetratricopeptide (TPR) repeat protein, partial [Crocinitomicaceae bacterium]